MILRSAGLAYQKGFGGHFHNDNSLAVLRDLPGIVLGIPTRADDASSMLDQAAALALEEGKVVVLVEPIALYHQRDLHAPGDEKWLQVPAAASPGFGRARVYDEHARDLLIVSYGNGAFLSLRAARTLRREHDIQARVLDLRWLLPLPMEDVEHHLAEVGAALIVDECRITGSPSEEIVSRLVDRGLEKPLRRVASADCFIPLGNAARKVLVSEEDIVGAALAVVGQAPRKEHPPAKSLL
jgi:2-oxoisovalerate dehydrogenase E1 component